MKILVAAASKHGSTQQIADAIGAELQGKGFDVTVAPVRDVDGVDGYDGVVLGSAIYLGQWLKPAKEFVAREAAGLASIPVWVFSSGPIGRAGKPIDPADRRRGDEIADAIGAREHRVFDGKLDRKRLNLIERTAVRAAKSPDGDFRDWDEIRAWSDDIAQALEQQVS
jgi:menaquinone-dependent protoporphyrinogen oxidase